MSPDATGGAVASALTNGAGAVGTSTNKHVSFAPSPMILDPSTQDHHSSLLGSDGRTSVCPTMDPNNAIDESFKTFPRHPSLCGTSGQVGFCGQGGQAEASVERVKATPLSARLYPVGDGSLTTTVVRSSLHTPTAIPSNADASAQTVRMGVKSANQALPAMLKRALDRARFFHQLYTCPCYDA